VPAPQAQDVVVLQAYYTSLKGCPSYRKRITWLWHSSNCKKSIAQCDHEEPEKVSVVRRSQSDINRRDGQRVPALQMLYSGICCALEVRHCMYT